MTRTLADWLVRRRWALFVVALLLTALGAGGARLLTFSTDYRVFFGQENPQLQAFESLQNTYTKSDNVLFVLAPADGEVFSRHALAAVEWLTAQAWQMPYSIRVDSVSNFQHTYAEGDDLVVEDLVADAESYRPQDLARVRRIALREPLLVDRIVAPDGRVTGVNVVLQLPGTDPTAEMPAVVDFSRDLAARLQQRYPDIAVHLTGIVMLNHAFTENALQDMGTLIPLMFLVIVCFLALLRRTLWGTLATMLVIVLSIVTAMGSAGWLSLSITPPMASAPTIIMTLAVADCVHLLVAFQQCLRRNGDRRTAMVEALRINLQPIFLTSVATAIGFLSMNFSDAPPFHDLGNTVAIGVAAAFLYCLALLPALLVALPMRVPAPRERSSATIDRFADFVVARRRAILATTGLLVVGLVACIPANELNDEFVKYFDQRVKFRVDTDFTTEHLTGLYSIAYSLEAGGSGAISDPAYLDKLEEFADWYRRQPEVLHVGSLTDTMKRLNRNLHGDDPAWYRIPRSRELAAQYLLLYEMSLPYGLDLNNQINVDKSASKLDVSVRSLSSNAVIALEERAQRWLREHAPASMQSHGASPAIMFAHIGTRNIHSMLIGTTLALVLISLLLVAALRSVRLGLISLVPNLVPAGMAFGLWGLLVGQVGLALSVVVGMTLGIVVDDTVHFLSKYLRARREDGLSAEDAVRYAFHTVGSALWTTSIVLIAGFLVLTWSSFEINSGMGLLTAITIGLALLADFLLLPTLLMTLDNKDTYESNRLADSAQSTA